MRTETYCKGYFKTNGYNSFYDSSFNYIVDAEFRYVDITTQLCYDVNGVELGEYKTEKSYTKKEIKDVSNSCTNIIVQIDFEFKVIPCKDGVNADEIQLFIKTLNNSNIGKYHEGWNTDFRESKQEENKDDAQLIEIATFGKSRSVYKRIGKSFFDFNLKEYKSNLDKFCNDNPNWRLPAISIYETNIQNLCNYFLCTEAQLLKGNLSQFMIRRLQRNINTKGQIIKKRKSRMV